MRKRTPSNSFAIAAALLCLALPGRVQGASYYYSEGLAGSANNGTSWVNAWTNYSSIVWGVSGVNGDNPIFIDGGTTGKVYTAGFNMGTSGTAGHIITASVGTDAGHDGRAIFDGYNTNGALGGFINGAHYSKIIGPKTNLWIIGMVTSTSNRELGIGMYAGIPHDQEYTGIVISNSNNGFYFNSASNINVHGCVIRDLRGDYACRFSGNYNTNFDGLLFHDNDIELNGDFVGTLGGPDGIGCGNSVTMYNNKLRCVPGPVTIGQHPDGIQTLGGYIKVYNNYFANFLNSGFKLEPNNPSTQMREFYAWNNVVTVDDPVFAASTTINGKGCEMGGVEAMTNVVNVVIAHNTFSDLLGLAINGGNGTWPVTLGTYLEENNAIYNCGKNTGSGTNTSCSTMGNSNLVFNANSLAAGTTGTTNLIIDLPGNGTFTGYIQTNTPAPVTFRGYTPYAATNDYHLTVAIAGVNLGAFAITTDYYGNPRNTNSPTVGAIEGDSTPGAVAGVLGRLPGRKR